MNSSSIISTAVSQWKVRRSGYGSRIGSAALILISLGLFTVPEFFDVNVVQQLTSLLIFLILALMWNALAGYAGLVSVGQQAFIGFGAYSTIFLTQHGVSPYFAILLAYCCFSSCYTTEQASRCRLFATTKRPPHR